MGVNLQKMQETKAELDAKAALRAAGGARFWKAKVGNSKIRLLPPWTNKGAFADDFAREVAVHWNVGEENQRFLCPVKSPGVEGPCPICDLVAQLRKTEDPGDSELANELRPRIQYFSNIVDLEDPVYTQKDVDEYKSRQQDKSKEVPFTVGTTKTQVYGYGPSVYEKIVNLFAVLFQDLTDLKTGRDIIITRKGNDKNNTRYDVIQADATPLKVQGELRMTDLDAFQQPAKLEDMQGAVAGLLGVPAAPPPPQLPPSPSPAPMAAPQSLPPSTRQSAAPAPAPAPAAAPKTDSLPVINGEDAPECFGDSEVWSDTDAECTGGVKDGDEYDPCPFFKLCGEKCGTLQPEKASRRRRGGGGSGGAKTTNAADTMEAQMKAHLDATS